MKITIETANASPYQGVKIGNVYPVRGGRGVKYGHMQILLAITEPKESWQGHAALMLVVDKDGAPVGVTSYGLHAIEDLQPIAFVDGIDQINLTMRSI